MISYHHNSLPEQPDGLEMLFNPLVIDPLPPIVAVNVEDGDAVRGVDHCCEMC